MSIKRNDERPSVVLVVLLQLMESDDCARNGNS